MGFARGGSKKGYVSRTPFRREGVVVIEVKPSAEILKGRRLGPDKNELPATAFVFGDEVGGHMTRKKFNDLWRATCAVAKVENLHFHDLRREAGSQMLEAGNAVTTSVMRSATATSR